jgi:hypothetical protein
MIEKWSYNDREGQFCLKRLHYSPSEDYQRRVTPPTPVLQTITSWFAEHQGLKTLSANIGQAHKLLILSKSINYSLYHCNK